ncbi:unnamed protein product [Bemisia tabaci]|uniref:GON-4-like protein n=1 Tax=Bemisia tabaci TaxID=7038 RepID=A0A9P0AIJ5_BEMTA|nr:unnamed protein product [Bemisia tabaci]
MEENKNPSKSVWKFHSEDQRKRSHSSTDQKLSFRLELCSDDEKPEEKSAEVEDVSSSESSSTPKKKKTQEVDKELMPQVLNEMEEEIERQLDSKAEKTNLTVTNVKNILKSVITNEDVMAMVRQSLHNEQEGLDVKCIYEPKLTRAKAKELLKLQPLPVNLWPITSVAQSPSKSECHVLIQQELPEDSSDEEYNPNEDDQSDDDDEKNASSVASDVDSSPATPVSSCASTSMDDSPTVWTQDGMFKIPLENIGQRTRSKLCLSDTPLEAIEQAFIPPDITTDMYDWACDNEDWKDFLQEFAKPLDSEPAIVDDPEEDPEYNVLADEEEEVVDKEELRMDRAVKVSRKELNELMAELFDFTENVMHHASDDEDSKSDRPEAGKKAVSTESSGDSVQVNSTGADQQPTFYNQSSHPTYPVPTIVPNSVCSLPPNVQFPSTAQQLSHCNQKENWSSGPTQGTTSSNRVPCTPNSKTAARNAFSPLDLNEPYNASGMFQSSGFRTPVKDPGPEIEEAVQSFEGAEQSRRSAAPVEVKVVAVEQLLLLQQQMRQHVQLTTQHFLQCYQHPELSKYADQCRNILLNLENQAKEKGHDDAVFKASNLKSAIQVVKAWESLFAVPEVATSIKGFMEKMYHKHASNKKLRHDQAPEDLLFPPPFLELVAASRAFPYPRLLPPVPFFKRGSRPVRKKFYDSEVRLIIYGLDTYTEVVRNTESKFSVKEREWDVCPLIIENLVPSADFTSIKNLIMKKRYNRINNPIKEYYDHKKLPHIVHYVIPIKEGITLLEQPLNLLPNLWKNFVRLKRRKASQESP